MNGHEKQLQDVLCSFVWSWALVSSFSFAGLIVTIVRKMTQNYLVIALGREDTGSLWYLNRIYVYMSSSQMIKVKSMEIKKEVKLITTKSKHTDV